MEIDYTVQIWKEGAQYIAHAMPLDVISSGPTPQQASAALEEAIRLFLLTAHDHGTLDEVLEECGYIRSSNKWIGPDWVSTEHHSAVVGL